MTKLQLHTNDAPAAVGPYSQGVSAGRLVFTSGHLPMRGGVLITDDVAEAARASLENVAAILEAGHATPADVVKVTIFLKDMGDFAAVNVLEIEALAYIQ